MNTRSRSSPGNYTVTAELSGFKKVSLAKRPPGVDQKVRADLKLDVGQLSESVTIQAETPLIQTNSSERGTTFSERADRGAAPQRTELRQP